MDGFGQKFGSESRRIINLIYITQHYSPFLLLVNKPTGLYFIAPSLPENYRSLLKLHYNNHPAIISLGHPPIASSLPRCNKIQYVVSHYSHPQ
jgi:hypothetical protein